MSKNKIVGVLAVVALALGGAILGLSKASAHDQSELLQKQNEAMLEAQKRAAEGALEAQKKAMESALEGEKRAEENALEAQKKGQERAREEQKKANELQKEASSSEQDRAENEDNNASSTGDKEDNEGEGERHRSAVANFVHSLERIASSSPRGIGERVREVARSQNEEKDKTVNDLNEVTSRGAFMKFLIGVNQGAVSSLENSVEAIQNHIDNLNQIKASTTPEIQKSLDQEINKLSKEKDRVENVINNNKGRMGIFGWFLRFFQ